MRNKLQVESLVQACRLQPSVVPGVACSSVRSLSRAWAIVCADRRVKPDPAESSPQIVGNAPCKVTGRRIVPARMCRMAAARQVRPANIGSGRNPVPFRFPKALDRWRRFTLKRLRALGAVRLSGLAQVSRCVERISGEARQPGAARWPRDEGMVNHFPRLPEG